MIEFSSIRLKKCGPFKDATLQFPKGISIVYGLNKTNARASKNANGAGKSYLAGQIAEILHDSPIVGEKQDRVKSGTRTLTFTNNKGKTVAVERVGNKYNISIDGKAKKFRTIKLAQERLKRECPITEEEFKTYVYLDSRVPHPLVMGTSTERRRFFTAFFGLDKIDVERKLFLTELNKLSKVRSAHRELKAEYDNSKSDVFDKEKIQKLQARIAEYKEKLDALNSKNKRVQDYARLLHFWENSKEQAEQLLKLIGAPTAEAYEGKLADLKWSIKSNEEKLEDALAWEQYQRDTANYEEQYSKLSKDARELIRKLGLKEAKEKTKKHYRLYREAKEQKENIADKKERVTAQLSKIKLVRVEKPTFTEGEVRADLKTLAHQLNHALKFKKGVCSECGQEVAVKDVSKLRSTIAKLEKTLETIEAYAEYKADKETKKVLLQELDGHASKLDELKEKLAKYKKYAQLKSEIEDLPKKPKEFTGKKLESKVVQRMLKEDTEQMQLLKFCGPHLETIIAYKALTQKQIEAAKKASALHDEITEVNQKLSSLLGVIEAQRTLYKRQRRLKDRLAEMKEELKDEEALKLLVEAYSDKAMKKMAIKSISSRLMQTVNRYAKVVFPEDYTFYFEWESSQLSLLVHRRYGKRLDVSDVRKLSGAESKLFTLILVLALLSFVPAAKRSSLLVLDEPTANFSKETTESFKELLPILNKHIPSIVVITPKVEERYEGATNFTVVKEKGVARIAIGHPNEN